VLFSLQQFFFKKKFRFSFFLPNDAQEKMSKHAVNHHSTPTLRTPQEAFEAVFRVLIEQYINDTNRPAGHYAVYQVYSSQSRIGLGYAPFEGETRFEIVVVMKDYDDKIFCAKKEKTEHLENGSIAEKWTTFSEPHGNVESELAKGFSQLA
jgi:hypothetical protein